MSYNASQRFANGRTEIIPQVSFGFEHKRIGRAISLQLLIRHAWAITVHESHSMTLDAVDLSGQFGVGQAYVGLSRCNLTHSEYAMLLKVQQQST